MLATLPRGDAHARRAWCEALPSSLAIGLEGVGCDTTTEPDLLGSWSVHAQEPQPLASLRRLPRSALHGSALPPVDALAESAPVAAGGPAIAYHTNRELFARLGTLAAISTVLVLTAEPPRHADWTSTPSFDDTVRDSLRARSRGGREAAGIASDALLGTLAMQLIADWWLQRDVYPSLRSLYVDSSWLMATEVLTRSMKAATGRQRPYVNDCRLDANYSSSCFAGRDDNASFFSGHSSWGGALAGLVCARRQAREGGELEGRRWGDVAWCGFAVAASLGIGLLRIAADEHHMSDVGAGLTAGFITGFVMPRMFDYRAADGGWFSRFQISPLRHEEAWGLQYSFRF